jgi:hypothetical protein
VQFGFHTGATWQRSGLLACARAEGKQSLCRPPVEKLLAQRPAQQRRREVPAEGRPLALRTSSPSCQWPNWINLILAIWLFISPWVIGFAHAPNGTGAATANGAVGAHGPAMTAAWDVWIVAVIVAVLSIAAISRFAVWEDWVNLVLGVWLFFSPWILGYSGLQNATWNSLVVGFLFAVVAIWGIVAARSLGTEIETRVETTPRS